MNRIIILFALILMPIASFAQSFDKIVKTNVETRGGKAALDAINTYVIKGDLVLDDSVAQSFKANFKYPDKFRIEIYVEQDTYALIFDGKQYWTMMPMLSNAPYELPSDKKDEIYNRILRPCLEFDSKLSYYKENGFKVKVNNNKDSINTIPQLALLCSKDEKTEIVFVNLVGNLISQINGSYIVAGKEKSVIIKLNDYKMFGDIMKPTSISVVSGTSKLIDMKINEYIFNKEMPDEMFRMQ